MIIKRFLDGMDEIDIALKARWEGDSNQFIKALLDAGFLENNGSGIYMIHGWTKHQPWVIGIKERSEHAHRSALISHHGSDEHAGSMLTALPHHLYNRCQAV